MLAGVMKFRLKVDDSFDVFAVHGGGGIIGSLLVAVLVVGGRELGDPGGRAGIRAAADQRGDRDRRPGLHRAW